MIAGRHVSSFTLIQVYSLQSTYTVYNPNIHTTIQVYSLQSKYTVYNPNIQSTVQVYSLQSKYTVYNQRIHSTIQVYSLQYKSCVTNKTRAWFSSPDKSYQNIPTLPSNFVVLSYLNNILTSIKSSWEKDTKTYGSNFVATSQKNWQM